MMQCPNCGAMMPAESLFCTACGKRLNADAPAPPEQPVAPPPPEKATGKPEPGKPVSPPHQDQEARETPPSASERHATHAGHTPPEPERTFSGWSPQPGAPGQMPYRNYAPPMRQPAFEDNRNAAQLAPVGIGAWIGVFVLLAIPLVNVVMTIIWACCAMRRSLRNFARALIVCWLVLLILAVVAGVLLARAHVSLPELLMFWISSVLPQ